MKFQFILKYAPIFDMLSVLSSDTMFFLENDLKYENYPCPLVVHLLGIIK